MKDQNIVYLVLSLAKAVATEDEFAELCDKVQITVVEQRNNLIEMTNIYNDMIVAMGNRDIESYKDALLEQQRIMQKVEDRVNRLQEDMNDLTGGLL